MKFVILCAIFLTICFICGVESECCKKDIYIVYEPKDAYDCSDIEDGSPANTYFLPKCIVLVCGDGRNHRGTFCGIGSCNFFGCNCQDGCHRGDSKIALEHIRKNYANKLTLSRLMTTEELRIWNRAY